jgi:putative ABC transport system permease protein
MSLTTLLLRNLSYFWRSSIAVVLGVGTAVAVVSGALLVGDSVRGSLRDLFVQRLGKTDDVLTSTNFFRGQLVDDLQSDRRFGEAFAGACPLVMLSGVVIDDKSSRRASNVQVYGVDERFWKFHGIADVVKTPNEREALLSEDLARELGTEPGQTTLLRIEKPSAIPAGSLHGRKEDLGKTIRMTFREALDSSRLGEFSLRPSQGPVRAIFVAMSRLQKDLDQNAKVNAILFADKARGQTNNPSVIAEMLKDDVKLEDVGVKLRVLDRNRGIALESDTAMISENLYDEARDVADKSNLEVTPILSYLANSIRTSVLGAEVPYSIVTAITPKAYEKMRGDLGDPVVAHARDESGERLISRGLGSLEQKAQRRESLPRIALNDWAASDLGVHRGDVITLEYYLWEDEGRLQTKTAEFMLDAIVPLNDATTDRDLVPDYPGLTETENMSDWDPPFPVDLKKVRPKDEAYWHKYRTTPKAFISLDDGLRLWQSRHGKFTSLRLTARNGGDAKSQLEAFKQGLLSGLNPLDLGISVSSVRASGLEASKGATDFGEYFVYFSFFLVIGALLLASLFFKLGIEQRLREIGTLRAVGFSASTVRSLFLKEGLVLAIAGSLLGILGAIAYGSLIVYGLRTWWIGAVGTTKLSLHFSPLSLIFGAFGGVLAALLCIVWTLRALKNASPRDLLSGNLEGAVQGSANRSRLRSRLTPQLLAMVFAAGGIILLIAAWLHRIGHTPGFFGAGSLLLAAALAFEYAWLARRSRQLISGRGWWPVAKLGFRNATYRPGRSTLCVALIASAAFIIVAVDAFKRGSDADTMNKKGGAGGYPLLAESHLPIYHDLNTNEGRDALNIVPQRGFDPSSVNFTGFRVRAGDDASCLNLYQPRNPRILGAGDQFIQSGRFSFQDSLAQTEDEKANPWLLLTKQLQDGAVPVIADANSMTYVLHRSLGDEIVVSGDNGEQIRLRLVAALSDSIFQSELLMSDEYFLKLLPDESGYSFFLMEMAAGVVSTAPGVLEEQLSDFGFDVVSTADRLAGFHRVENTYLSTFQTLGGLGLVLGTLGLASVLLRNVLERRRELALLRAIGYNARHFVLMVVTENAFLVSCGLLTGGICALIAIGPAFVSRGGQLPALSMWLLLIVFATGLFASLAATIAALRAPLLESLRAE